MRTALLLLLAACGHVGPVSYRVAVGSDPKNVAWLTSTVDELNARAGCSLVTLTDDPSAPEIFFVDPSTLTGEDAAGDYDPLTRRIRLTDYAKSPYIYATIDLSDQAAERLSLHELGHAMGIGHVEKIQANFDDDMWPSDGNYVAPVSDAVWSQYREQLNDAGVKCPTVPR